MKKLYFSFILLVSVFLNSCSLVTNTLKYKNTAEDFAENLIQKNYDKCIGMMAINSSMNMSIDTLKEELLNFREVIVNNFGEKLDYTFMSSEKRWSTDKEESTPENTTEVLVQFSNKKWFGAFKLLFDDKSEKIINIHALDVKKAIPSMIPFWLFGLLAMCIPVFNIYMISQVRKSNFKKKWLKYIAIIVLNVPAVTFKALGGFIIELLSFQILFGVSFGYMGYLKAAWTFGIPLGSLFILWQLKQKKNKTEEMLPESSVEIG